MQHRKYLQLNSQAVRTFYQNNYHSNHFNPFNEKYYHTFVSSSGANRFGAG